MWNGGRRRRQRSSRSRWVVWVRVGAAGGDARWQAACSSPFGTPPPASCVIPRPIFALSPARPPVHSPPSLFLHPACSPPCPLPTITPHPLPCPLQAKRLEELDSLYRDEAIMRKKIFNQMEDMKGKIRVYCRIRPILQMERDRGQTGGGWVGGSVLAVRVAVSVGRGRGGGGSLAPPLPAPHARCFSGPCLAARMLQPPALLCLPPCPHHPLQRRSRSPTSSPAR